MKNDEDGVWEGRLHIQVGDARGNTQSNGKMDWLISVEGFRELLEDQIFWGAIHSDDCRESIDTHRTEVSDQDLLGLLYYLKLTFNQIKLQNVNGHLQLFAKKGDLSLPDPFSLLADVWNGHMLHVNDQMDLSFLGDTHILNLPRLSHTPEDLIINGISEANRAFAELTSTSYLFPR